MLYRETHNKVNGNYIHHYSYITIDFVNNVIFSKTLVVLDRDGTEFWTSNKAHSTWKSIEEYMQLTGAVLING